MLVLSRKIGQSIVIGEKITVTVVAVKGNRVRLGIEAPEQIGVFRSELEVILPDNPDFTKEGPEGA